MFMLKELIVESKRPDFYIAHFNIDSKYKWGSGWEEKNAEDFRKEMKEKLPFLDFQFRTGRSRYSSDELVRESDPRQNVYLHPMDLSYVGDAQGFEVLKEKLQHNKFETFSLGMIKATQDYKDMTEEEVMAVYDDPRNKDIIRSNILESIRKKTANYRHEVIGNVYEFVRFRNTADGNAHGYSSRDIGYQKVVTVLDQLLKDHVVAIDHKDRLKVNVISKKKARLRPVKAVAKGGAEFER